MRIIVILIQLSLNFVEKDIGLTNEHLYINEIEDKINNKNKLLQIEDINLHNNCLKKVDNPKRYSKLSVACN